MGFSVLIYLVLCTFVFILVCLSLSWGRLPLWWLNRYSLCYSWNSPPSMPILHRFGLFMVSQSSAFSFYVFLLIAWVVPFIYFFSHFLSSPWSILFVRLSFLVLNWARVLQFHLHFCLNLFCISISILNLLWKSWIVFVISSSRILVFSWTVLRS